MFGKGVGSLDGGCTRIDSRPLRGVLGCSPPSVCEQWHPWDAKQRVRHQVQMESSTGLIR